MTRTRICLYILILAPLVLYWQTIFHDFGLRDDYSHLRESKEEPSELVKFTASHGRPLYGALLETSFASVAAEGVDGLKWLRLSSVLLLTLLALALWRQLYQSGWTEIEAAVIGLGIVLLPAAQVVTSWSVCWPHVLALLLAVAGFSAIETELERGGLKRVVALLGGGMIYCLSALIYQSNALFAVVPIAAVFLVRSGRDRLSDAKWLTIHLLTLVAGLALSYLLVRMLFNTGIFHASVRMQFETNPFTKLVWFFWEPLPNALALFALRDDFSTGAAIFWPAALLVAGVIGYGYRVARRRGDELAKKKWLICLVALPLLAHAVSLAAAERSIGYRVLFALSGLVLVMLVFTLRSLRAADVLKPLTYYPALALVILAGAVSANSNAFELLAEPQGNEWELILTPVMRANFKGPTKAYIITPTPDDRSTVRLFADEFGSLSSDSDWAPREMFHTAVRERFPGKKPPGFSYTVTLGRAEPAPGDYDMVIDLRKLRKMRAQ
jgi:hypothetical protein